MKYHRHKHSHSIARDRRRLAAWLWERNIDARLDDPEAPVIPMDGALRYDVVPARGADIRPGGIYLLRPSGSWGPVYVLVLERVSDHRMRVAPFSRYATPAVPGEWETPMNVPPLRVICFWNTVEMTNHCFLPGCVKSVPSRAWSDFQKISRHVLAGDPLDARLAARSGPPLVHPADPRYDYLEEERRRLEEHTMVTASPTADQDHMIVLEPEMFRRPSWLMAAEGRPRYDSRSDRGRPGRGDKR